MDFLPEILIGVLLILMNGAVEFFIWKLKERHKKKNETTD